MQQIKEKTKHIINFLSSLTFTVIIIITLTLTALINLMEAEIFSFIEGYLPQHEATIRNLFKFFVFSDLYYSWWFKTLLMLFSINLLICTLKRIPQTLRTLAPFRPRSDQLIPSNLRLKETFNLNELHPDFEHRLRCFLSKKWSNPSIHHRNGVSAFFSQKGRYAFLGFYLAHLGLLFILIGGIVSSFGYEGDIYIRKGETIDTFFAQKGLDQFIKQLCFSLRLDRCEALPSEKKGDHPQGSSCRSTITILREGEKVKTGIVEGYRTIKHKGFRIAQLSFLEKENPLISLLVIPKRLGRESRVYTLRRNEPFKVPETGHTIRIKNILSPTSSQLKEGIMLASAVSSEQRINSSFREMVSLEVYGENNKLLYSPLIHSYKKVYRGPWDEDYEFSILEIDKIKPTSPYSQLSVSYEPGANLIWMGFYIAIIGFSMMFLLSHRKLWVKVEQMEGKYHITLAGWVSRNPEVIKDSFKDIKKLARGHIIS